MSEETKEVTQLVDATNAHTLVIESTHEYKFGTMGPMDLVFKSTFDNQSMSICCIWCVGKLWHLFCFH